MAEVSLRTHPVDILFTNWDNGISAAFNVTVTSPLNSSVITVWKWACTQMIKFRKHSQNDVKCAELSWKCIPPAVERYGAWASEASHSFSHCNSNS